MSQIQLSFGSWINVQSYNIQSQNQTGPTQNVCDPLVKEYMHKSEQEVIRRHLGRQSMAEPGPQTFHRSATERCMNKMAAAGFDPSERKHVGRREQAASDLRLRIISLLSEDVYSMEELRACFSV